MGYCINPYCSQPNNSENTNRKVCANCGSKLALSGGYKVKQLLSDRSGFANIYDAYLGTTPKILKILKCEHNNNPKAVELFQQEAKVLSQLNSSHIPQVEPYQPGKFWPKNRPQPLHYFLMEKIDGLNLKQWMQQHNNKPITQEKALTWLQQLAEILHLVHSKNYFHRDIKPQNIMIRNSNDLVLIDFGAAREMTFTYLAQVGGSQGLTRINTPGYTPPEQEKGRGVPQSDFYSLGRTFVYLLTGRSVTDSSIYDPLRDELHWRPYAPQVSEPLADFIDYLIATKAINRPKNTEELLDCLGKISPATKYAITSPPTKIEGKFAFSWRKPWFIVSAASFILTLAGYGIWEAYDYYHNPTSISYKNTQIIRTLKGHSSFINVLAISSDGKKLYSAGADKTIKIWDLNEGKEILDLIGHSSFINDLVISPDGKKLYSAGADKTIKAWDLNTGKELFSLKGHDNYINSLALSTDGKILASAGADYNIKIWNLSSQVEIATLKGHKNFVNDLVISADGQSLISGSADGTIQVWNLITGKKISILTGHESYVNRLAITPDGNKLASASADKTIKIWDLNKGEAIRTLTGHANYVNSLAISPDGNILVSVSADKTIKFWNLTNGELISTITESSKHVNFLAISYDWQIMATSSGDRNIQVWQLGLSSN